MNDARPGQMVAAVLLSQRRTRRETAKAMGISPSYLSDVILGRRPVSPAFALRFEELTGLMAEALYSRQALHDLEDERRRTLRLLA